MDEIIYRDDKVNANTNTNTNIMSKYIKITNEIYNPEYPNDYEEYLKEKNKIKKSKQIEEEKARKSKINKQPTKNNKIKRILEKMGWTGKGLGKYEQGIVTPLYIKKIHERFGIIINENINKTNYNMNPTRIIVITNIINPDDIQLENYNEIRMEVEKFGIVKEVKFFQFDMENIQISLEDSVRVFVEYEEIPQAIRAYDKLYNRYYAERLIKVKFYNEELYMNNKLDSFL